MLHLSSISIKPSLGLTFLITLLCFFIMLLYQSQTLTCFTKWFRIPESSKNIWLITWNNLLVDAAVCGNYWRHRMNGRKKWRFLITITNLVAAGFLSNYRTFKNILSIQNNKTFKRIFNGQTNFSITELFGMIFLNI
jgi:hypothetical protein